MTARIIMKLRVVEAHDETGGVRVLTLKHPLRNRLPAWTAGAHVDLRLPDGKIRQYSLCGDPDDHSYYRIAVKLEETGRGGSKWVHEHLRGGAEAHVSAPRCNFALKSPAKRHFFIAGGIGITPFLAMAMAARENGATYSLAYCSNLALPPFFEELRVLHGEKVNFYGAAGAESRRFDPASVLPGLAEDTHLYCCGPARLTEAVRDAAVNWPQDRLHFEVFQPTLDENFKPEPFDITIASTGQKLRVASNKSALDVLREAGFVLPSSCELGVCGSCECGYRDGVVLHRDQVLGVGARQDRMMLCVSRARVAVTLEL